MSALRAVPPAAGAVEGWCDLADADVVEVMLELALEEVVLRRASAARARPVPVSLGVFLRA